ncbi:MAG: tRNA preQ1(34) S-adenosylmethionine ribosyltransferase-isomerase QueA [Gammaproteobacteria bacterium]
MPVAHRWVGSAEAVGRAFPIVVNMHVAEFDYSLPPALIAHYPTPRRTDSRLLVLESNSGALQALLFPALLQLLDPHDLLVVNNTRVIKARLSARKLTGGHVEVLIERILEGGRALALLRANKTVRPGTVLELDSTVTARVVGRKHDLYELDFVASEDIGALLARLGTVPLPPYIRRSTESLDSRRYQTVYAEYDGSVAAPTAGLHFDEPLLEAIRQKGVRQVSVTLHVGAGTFQPLRGERVEAHRLHSEYLEVSDAVCCAVAETRARGGRVVAVGTTTARALETAASSGDLRPFRGDTRLFIYPGFQFQCVDALVTNFHLPRSSLLMLVCAFAGQELVLDAYRYAVTARFRFFSYGDAMFVTRRSR